MNIEIITTPNEGWKETGFGALDACNSVLKSIKKTKHTVQVSVCKTIEDLDCVVQRQPGLVILAVKYIAIKNEDDVWLSEYFSNNHINFSGSSRETLRFDSDKVLAKAHLRKKGVKTANYFTAIPGQYKCENDLPLTYPLFLKPLDAANGNGVDDGSLVSNFSEFESKILSLYRLFNLPILVEEYLDGQEFTVAVMRTVAGDLIVSPIEIIPPESLNGLRILGQKVKHDDSEILKKTNSSIIVDNVKQLAIDAFIGLGVRGFGRIDIKTNLQGECFFMEANLVPGMTYGSSYFPKACEMEHELNYDSVIRIIVDECISRAVIPPLKISKFLINQTAGRRNRTADLLITNPDIGL